MRRFFFIAVLAAALFALMAASSALATIHPLVNSECSAPAADGTPADSQNPPGITDGGVDQSHATQAQPVLVANGNAFKPAGCPAPNQ
jgi:hypothetical protein